MNDYEIQILNGFLSKNKCYYAYWFNVKSDKDYVEETESSSRLEWAISAPFKWKETLEGWDYWDDINMKWLDHINIRF